MTIPTYVIACDELPDRKQAISTHLQQMGVYFEFIRSVHGRTWGIQTVREYEPGKRITPGHVGLCLGHWIAWEVISHSPLADNCWVLILEDDAVLPDGWKNRLMELRKELDTRFPDCEFCFVGMAETEPHVWHKVTERIGGGDSRLCRLNDPFGTHAYMVRKGSLPVLMDRMRTAEKNMDQQLFTYVLRDNHLKWCAVLPTLIRQRTFDYVGSGKPEWSPSCLDEHPDVIMPTQVVPEPKRIHAMETKPSEELYQKTMKLISPFSCIYRGEHLVAIGKHPTGRTVPLSVCWRKNLPCHTKPNLIDVVTPKGDPTESCERCELRQGIAAPNTRPRLNVPEGHFNPSMLMYQGKLVFATRDNWGHSNVALWEMTNTNPDWTGEWSAKPIGSFASEHPEAPRLEDPRLFINATGNLCSVFNLPDGYPPKLVNVGYSVFDRDLTRIEHTEIFRSPNNNKYEKNWVPFLDPDQKLNWVYATKPEHVVIGPYGERFTTTNDLPWAAGVVRGGACPMKHHDVFYHFFHGCLARLEGRVYTVGCCVFDAKPPYRVLRQTRIPLLSPDLPGPGEDVVKRFVVWVGGAVYHANAWHLAIGIDDSFCRIVRIPADVVESALTDVPETDDDRVVSIRDTPLAMGTAFNEPLITTEELKWK